MAQYRVQYIMPVWYQVTFEAQDGLTDTEVWEEMKAMDHHHDGTECAWSYDYDFWNDAIENSEACLIENTTDNVVLFEQP